MAGLIEDGRAYVGPFFLSPPCCAFIHLFILPCLFSAFLFFPAIGWGGSRFKMVVSLHFVIRRANRGVPRLVLACCVLAE